MAIVRRTGIIARAAGSTGKMVVGSSAAEKSGVTMRTSRNTTVITIKRDRRQKSTKKQREQRKRFCDCDKAYNDLSNWQKAKMREYTRDYNMKHHTQHSPHSLWMKLCLTGQLNEFFENYLGMEISELIREEGEEESCYTLYVKWKEKPPYREEDFTIGRLRR